MPAAKWKDVQMSCWYNNHEAVPHKKKLNDYPVGVYINKDRFCTVRGCKVWQCPLNPQQTATVEAKETKVKDQ